MEKKTNQLPDDFELIMKRGNIDELKEVYDACLITAHARGEDYEWFLPFYFETPCQEFYKWLVSQGLDINVKNSEGATPLYMASSITHVIGLLYAGADVNEKNGPFRETVLHKAARLRRSFLHELLEYGANVNMKDKYQRTPLDHLLLGAKCEEVDKVVWLAKELLAHGAESTVDVSGIIRKIGDDYEFKKRYMTAIVRERLDPGMNELYQIFHVDPVPPLRVHDGVSDIEIHSTDYNSIIAEIWELLIPPMGKCKTVQGEVIRISCKIEDWFLSPFREEWRAGFDDMLKAIPEMLYLGNHLEEKKYNEARKLAQTITQRSKSDKIQTLCHLCVEWVLLNPKPIPLGTVIYKV